MMRYFTPSKQLKKETEDVHQITAAMQQVIVSDCKSKFILYSIQKRESVPICVQLH